MLQPYTDALIRRSGQFYTFAVDRTGFLHDEEFLDHWHALLGQRNYGRELPLTAPQDFEKLQERSITKLNDNEALEHIGELIDASHNAKSKRGAERSLCFADKLAKRDLTPKLAALLEHFRANARSLKEDVARGHRSWEWEHPYREQQILALSRAVAHPGFVELDIVRRCQILTNCANQLNVMGRFIDATEGWDEALRIDPKFAIAHANRGYGLKQYGGLLDDDREREIFLLHAYDWLARELHDAPCLKEQGIDPEAYMQPRQGDRALDGAVRGGRHVAPASVADHP